MTKEKAYALFWLTRLPDGEVLVNTLVYSPPSGKEVRTYREGHLDPRAGNEAEFPRFDHAVEAFEWMVAHTPEVGEGEKALVEIEAAKLIRGTDRYAEPV